MIVWLSSVSVVGMTLFGRHGEDGFSSAPIMHACEGSRDAALEDLAMICLYVCSWTVVP